MAETIKLDKQTVTNFFKVALTTELKLSPNSEANLLASSLISLSNFILVVVFFNQYRF